MADKGKQTVSMRVRVGDAEVEVSGPADFVKKEIHDFLKEHRELLGRQSAVDPGARAKLGGKPAALPNKETSIAQFFKKTGPKSDVHRALLAGYFLEKYSQMDRFTAAEVRDVIRSAKVAPPQNTNDAIAKNIKKGLMMTAGDKEGKMAFVLTSDGEEVVTSTFAQG